MSRGTRRIREGHERGEVPDDAAVAYFKERIYATFTGLAILLVVAGSAHAEPAHAVTALVLGVIGIVAAGTVSDVVAHLVVHQHMPDGAQWRVLGRVAFGALSTALVPTFLLLLSLWGAMSVHEALRSAIITYVITLAVIGWFAVRRSQLPRGQRLMVLGGLVALGLAVVGVQMLAHAA